MDGYGARGQIAVARLLFVLDSRNDQVTRAKARGRLKARTVNRVGGTSRPQPGFLTSPLPQIGNALVSLGRANWDLMTSQILIEHLSVRVLCDCTIERRPDV